LAELVAVDSGEVAVQNDDIVGSEIQFAGGLEAVVGDVNGHALIAQPFSDLVRELREVLDDQDPHPCAPAG
jgi:hypothetical protein